jgi:hypothetical protein
MGIDRRAARTDPPSTEGPPSMSASASRVTATALVAAGMTSLLSLQVSAQAGCDWYAQTALKQQQENERLKCGLIGAAWTNDLKAHQAWCGSVAPDQMKTEAQAREQQLQACAKKK